MSLCYFVHPRPSPLPSFSSCGRSLGCQTTLQTSPSFLVLGKGCGMSSWAGLCLLEISLPFPFRRQVPPPPDRCWTAASQQRATGAAHMAKASPSLWLLFLCCGAETLPYKRGGGGAPGRGCCGSRVSGGDTLTRVSRKVLCSGRTAHLP